MGGTNTEIDVKTNEIFQKYIDHIKNHSGYTLNWSSSQPLHKDIAFNFINEEHRIQFPIRYKDRIVGTAEIKSEKVVSHSEAQKLSDMIDLLFGPTIDNIERLKFAQRLEDNMLNQKPANNVISLNKKRMEKFNIEPTVDPVHTKKRPQLYAPILIQGQNDYDISRLALEIHYSLDRMAFLHYGDLDLATRIQVSELKSLGSISLFVPNIMELSRTEKSTLIDMCAETGRKDIPLIIAGTTSTYQVLLAKMGYTRELTQSLSETYLRMTKSFKDYKEQGILPFIYENLTRPVTHLDS